MPQGVWVQVPPSARETTAAISGRHDIALFYRRPITTDGTPPVLETMLHAPTALIPWLDPRRSSARPGRGALLVVCFIIFAETGLLVGFLLPGDTLLIIAGLLTHTSNVFGVNIWVVSLLIALSAFIGGEVGYLIGHKGGPAIFERKESGLFSKKNVERTERVLRALRRSHGHPGALRPDRAHLRPGRSGRRTHAVASILAVQLHRRHDLGLRPHDGRLPDRLHPVGARSRRRVHRRDPADRGRRHRSGYALALLLRAPQGEEGCSGR